MFNQNRFVKPYKYKQKHPLSGDADLRLKPVSPFEKKEKRKERSPEEYKDLINRLSRIEGQIRGIKAMVEKGAYCPDILTQASAANAALNSFCKVLLSNHIRTCVRNDIREGNDEVVEELVATLQKMMK